MLTVIRTVPISKFNPNHDGDGKFTGRGGVSLGTMGYVQPLRGTGSAHAAESTVKNPNPMTPEAKNNLKSVGKRVSLEEMKSLRKKAIAKINDAPLPDAADEARFKASKQNNKRAGGELRGNYKDRAARKAKLLKEFGDGHTCGCVHCGVRLSYNTVTEDKIHPMRGYKYPNLIPACSSCNSSRQDKPIHDQLGVKKPRVKKADVTIDPKTIYRGKVIKNPDLVDAPDEVVGRVVTTTARDIEDSSITWTTYTIKGWSVDSGSLQPETTVKKEASDMLEKARTALERYR